MAINLFTLDTPETVPQKVYKLGDYAKIDQSNITENWDEIKASAKGDLIEESKKNGYYRESGAVYESSSTLKPAATANGGVCNYQSDAFFKKDMPLVCGVDGNFMVGGAVFSKEELEECRAVMKAAANGIGCGIGKNADISYVNYAEMEIAANSVSAYASKNLNEKQAAVVNKAMKEYNDALTKLEEDTLSRKKAVEEKERQIAAAKQYELSQPASSGVYDTVNKHSGGSSSTKDKEDIGTTPSGRNKELIGKIKNLFSNIDISDAGSWDPIMEKYKELVTPAYLAFGWNSSNGTLARMLNRDVSGFKSFMTNMMNAMHYRAIDYKL